VTLLPDYLYRRYVQGKRLGKEITFYSVWFELRWSTSNVTIFFRTVSILPETTGRVAEIFVGASEPVAKGTPIFRLDSSKQEAAVELAQRKIAETDAQILVARWDVVKADGELRQANSERQQTVDELEAKQELYQRNPSNVPFREIERLQERERGQLGAIDAATATKQSVEQRISTLLPAEKATAEAELAEAQVELGKTVIRAGVSGRVEQFLLRVGDVVNPLAFPAGILIPEGAGYRSLQAGFGQIEAQIMKVGMAAEVTCVSKPFTIIPMVVTGVQDYVAAGQFRGGEQLIDAQQVARPGTLLVFLRQMLSRRICFPSHMAQKLVHLFAARTCQRRRRRSESRLSRF
jgi:multidrug resistance efflux pump